MSYWQVTGCVVLGFGAYVLITGADIVDLIDKSGEGSIKIYSSAAILLIVIACAVVLVTFFGCFGAFKVQRCMLGTYFTMILVLFICILVGAVIAVTQDLDFVEDALKKTMDEYGNDGNSQTVVTEAWDGIQSDVSIFYSSTMYYNYANAYITKNEPSYGNGKCTFFSMTAVA